MNIIKDITEYIISFLKMTAWRMYRPELFGFVHAYGFVIVVGIAVFAAIVMRKISREKLIRLITVLGWVLVVMEIYKQLFYYFIVNDGAYDFWFFPFQLCSMPMYMCVLLPFLRKKKQDVLLTFMCGFTFVSAMAALVYPEDMLRPFITLTVHGFLWHGIILFISLLIGISGTADLSLKGFLRSAGLFLILAAAAILINVLLDPVAQSSAIKDSYPNMFYLSPLHPFNQPFIDKIELEYGKPVAMAAYTAAIIVLAGVADLAFGLISKVAGRRR